MKRIIVPCLAAMMLLAALTGCRNSNTDASPSPIVSASPNVTATPGHTTSPGITDGGSGIIDGSEDDGTGAVGDLLDPSASIMPTDGANEKSNLK